MNRRTYCILLLIYSAIIVYGQDTDDPTTSTITTTTVDPEPSSTPPTTTSQPPTTTNPPTTTEEPPQIIDVTGNSFTWDQDSPNHHLIITAEEGYSIAVNISNVNIDSALQSYILIRSGGLTLEPRSEGKIFIFTVAAKKRILFNTNSVYVEYVETEESSTDRFTVTFDIFGEPKTTTSTISTTTIDWPTTQEDDSVYITVDVFGKTSIEFGEKGTVENFKNCVAGLATKYCENQSFELAESITSNNVLITDIYSCPFSWPNSDKCVKIKFRLPIFLLVQNTYQLKTSHLEMMWKRFDNYNLEECIGFSPYIEPKVNDIVVWWIIGFVGVTILFILILWFLRLLAIRFGSYFRKRRNSDTISIVSTRRNSVLSLTPHYLQETPKLFENEFPMMDPAQG